jgi:hypothetical protein
VPNHGLGLAAMCEQQVSTSPNRQNLNTNLLLFDKIQNFRKLPVVEHGKIFPILNRR